MYSNIKVYQKYLVTSIKVLVRNRLVFMCRPERFAGAFIICIWIVCPFVNYSLSLTYKVQYLDFGWFQSIQSKVQCKFIDGLLTRQWHHMPIGVWDGLKYMYRAWIFCKSLTLLPPGAFVFHELILLYNHSQIYHWHWVKVKGHFAILPLEPYLLNSFAKHFQTLLKKVNVSF